jgi:hypothetical protein
VAAARQIRDDDAKFSLELARLQSPVGSARAETVNQQDRLAAPALEIMQRATVMYEPRHCLFFASTIDCSTNAYL